MELFSIRIRRTFQLVSTIYILFSKFLYIIINDYLCIIGTKQFLIKEKYGSYSGAKSGVFLEE